MGLNGLKQNGGRIQSKMTRFIDFKIEETLFYSIAFATLSMIVTAKQF